MSRISARLHFPVACLLIWIIWADIGTSQRQPQPGEYPSLHSIPRTSFDCRKRPIGYYADPDPTTKCQVYHMCDMNGKKFSYLCPNGTLFHQQHLICAHWYQVNCTRSEALYERINSHMFPFPSGFRSVQWPKPTERSVEAETAPTFGTPLRKSPQDSRQPPPPPPPPPPTTEAVAFGDVTAVTASTNQGHVSNDIPPVPISNQQQHAVQFDTQSITNAINPVEVFDDNHLANSVTQQRQQQRSAPVAWWFTPATDSPAPLDSSTETFGATLPRQQPTVQFQQQSTVAFIVTTEEPPVARSLLDHHDETLQSGVVEDAVRQSTMSRLTMTFPKNRYRASGEGRGLSTDKCPHCNPYFVKNELLCFPCVVIR